MRVKSASEELIIFKTKQVLEITLGTYFPVKTEPNQMRPVGSK